jgi:hypothetical protein
VDVTFDDDHRLFTELNSRKMGLSISAFLRFVLHGGGPMVTWSQFKAMSLSEIRAEIQQYAGPHPGSTRKEAQVRITR